jgi:hypothetical protein
MGFGLSATAGTYAAGLTLSLRDVSQDWGGRRYVLGLIALGGALSFLVADGRIALASLVAFTVSELADWAVYQPLRDRSWYGAVAASNLVGAVVDTCLFLGIAFGVSSIRDALPGQLVGKAWVTLAFLAVAYLVRRRRGVPVGVQA